MPFGGERSLSLKGICVNTKQKMEIGRRLLTLKGCCRFPNINACAENLIA